MQVADGRGSDLRHQWHRSQDSHADAVAMQVDVLGLALPNVAGGAFGPREVKGHGSRMDHGEHVSLARIRSGDRRAVDERDVVPVPLSSKEVDPGQVRPETRARAGRHLLWRAGCLLY